uniref:Uncharacterized protein n=1 Tax=Anguilla anguilla TaxID=7936 RepID=A0A0E9W948_ANGAN
MRRNNIEIQTYTLLSAYSLNKNWNEPQTRSESDDEVFPEGCLPIFKNKKIRSSLLNEGDFQKYINPCRCSYNKVY